jgi:hypothetical protein
MTTRAVGIINPRVRLYRVCRRALAAASVLVLPVSAGAFLGCKSECERAAERLCKIEVARTAELQRKAEFKREMGQVEGKLPTLEELIAVSPYEGLEDCVARRFYACLIAKPCD